MDQLRQISQGQSGMGFAVIGAGDIGSAVARTGFANRGSSDDDFDIDPEKIGTRSGHSWSDYARMSAVITMPASG